MHIEYGCSMVGHAACFVDYTASGDLFITPASGLNSSAPFGGPFTPGFETYTPTNNGTASLDWQAAKTQTWVDLTIPTSGTLDSGMSTTVTVSINSVANGFASRIDAIVSLSCVKGGGL
jgi:hypothetical protein